MWGNPLTAYEDKRIVKAYNFFRSKLVGRGQLELKSLWMSVFAHIKFVVIILDDDDDEQQIFDTINGSFCHENVGRLPSLKQSSCNA